MLRLDLTSAHVEALRALRRTPLAPAERDRVEMALLNLCGWSPPALAEHFGYEGHVVRRILHAIAADGVNAIAHKKTGPVPDREGQARIEGALRARLAETRIWDAVKLQAALHADGVMLSTHPIKRHLHRLGARYRRTKPSLRHR